MPKKIGKSKKNLSRKKVKKLKKRAKKTLKFLFKVKPLEEIKFAKIKKLTKSVKPVPRPGLGTVKKIKPIKPTKPIEPPIYRARIKVIGIGGGGSSIVSEIASRIKKANFIVANTDLQALKDTVKEAKHFPFGKSLTGGLGTGMNPELGKQAAESEKEKIKKLLKDTDFCILISCLGGGTGSGASPVFAEILKKLGILTLGIFTLPFEFEGGKRTQIAKDSLEKLRANLNASVIIPNQKIFQIVDKNTPLKEALSVINKNLAESLEGLIEMIYSPGLINIDFATLKTILLGRGRLAYLNTLEAKTPNQIEELAQRVLSNPLSPYSSQGAKDILFNINGGLNLNISQVNQIGKIISDSINPRARVAFGITQNKKDYYPATVSSPPFPRKGGAPRIKITLLANGCKWKEWDATHPPPSPAFPRKGGAPKEKPEKKVTKKPEIKSPKLPKVAQPKAPQSFMEETTTRPPHPPIPRFARNEPLPKKKVKEPSQAVAFPSPQIEKTEPNEKVKIKVVRQNALDSNPPKDGSSSRLAGSSRVPTTRQGKTYIRKTLQEEEEKMLAEEKKWETPAFLRRNSRENSE